MPSDPSHSKGCGKNVALDGDTALVACGSGGIYAYVRSGATWTEQGLLVPSGSGIITSLDLQGDVAVIGNRSDGTASVFRRTGLVWAEEQVLVTSSLPVDDFGQSVAVEGDTIVVGAP